MLTHPWGGLFWPLPGLFLASSWPLPGLFLASSGPVLASSWPLPSLFLASSWPLPGLFWVLASFGLFLASSGPLPERFSKISKIEGPQRSPFLFINYCVSSSFSPNSGFLAFRGLSWPLLACPGLFLASSGLFLASSWPPLGFSWILQNLQN